MAIGGLETMFVTLEGTVNLGDVACSYVGEIKPYINGVEAI